MYGAIEEAAPYFGSTYVRLYVAPTFAGADILRLLLHLLYARASIEICVRPSGARPPENKDFFRLCLVGTPADNPRSQL